MPRFVILTHNRPFLHWDLMLETEHSLRTWRLLEEPSIGSDVPAERLPDHRREYLDYEGPISGDRGTVRQWDAGQFEQIAQVENRERLRLHGSVIDGECVITDRTAQTTRISFLPAAPG